MPDQPDEPKPPSKEVWVWSIAAAVMIIWLGLAFNHRREPEPVESRLEGAGVQPLPEVSAPTGWRYDTFIDNVRQDKSRTACIHAQRPLSLAAPHHGATAELCMRAGSLGNDVYLQVTKGQIVCRSYMKCRIPVRIGNSGMKLYDGTEPTDFSLQTLFISPPGQIREAMKRGEEIAIEVPFYRSGNQQMVFNTSGFASARWEAMAR